MKPLIILLVVFILAILSSYLFTGEWQLVFAGNLAMSAMLMFTALGHFKFPQGMSLMVPDILPFRVTIIYVTGLLEIVAAIGLMVPTVRHIAAVFLIIFFIAILPANIYAAMKRVNLEKGNYEGPGPSYLWFRIPLQVFFIAWICYFCLEPR